MKESLEQPKKTFLEYLMENEFDVIVIGGGPGDMFVR